jgi:teichuronic acid biosynthesis glycosyltransferase TuaG
VSGTYSVVVPAYNAENTIETCLGSVIAQTLAPLEVLVIDDASSDGTGAVVQKCKAAFATSGIGLEYFCIKPNAGPSGARNRGIRAAKGAFIAFLDADDSWAPGKLAIVDQFTARLGAGLICHEYTDKREPLASGNFSDYEARPLSISRMLVRNPAQTSCAVVRKTGDLAFDETLRRCEDYDLWMRIAEHAPAFRIVGPPLARLGRPQLSAGGLSGDTLGMRAGELRVYLNFCLRHPFVRIWLLPVLMCMSILKHAYSWLRRVGR